MKRAVSCILMLCLLLSFSAFSSLAASNEGHGVVFVAKNGKDTAEGTIEAPLATLQAAQAKVRSMKASGEYTSGITVFVRGGTYNISKPLVLTAEDSGTSTCPITWRRYEDETVTFTAGVKVSGSQFKKVTEQAVLNRIVDVNGRNNLYVLDLKVYGVDDPGEPYLFGSYGYSSALTDIGLVKRPNAPAMEIFFNDTPMTNARYPNEGYMTVGKVVELGWDYDEPNRVPQGTPFTITVTDDRIKYWTKAPEDSIMMFGYWKWEWADQTIPLHKIDVSNMRLTSKWCSIFSVLPDKPFYVTNLLEELDRPGEYYVDRENSKLYINPPSDLKSASVTLTVMEEVPFQINGANYITLKGLDVNGSRNSAYSISKGEHNTIVDCDISYTAKKAAVIAGTHNGIRDSYIHDVDGGVGLSGGDIATLTEAENFAENNHIERFTRLTKTYMPAVSIDGVGNRAMHNEMNDAAHQAISFGGQCNKIMYNNIYNVLQETDDAGAIYGGLSWHERGHEIKYNYIHDCKAEGASGDSGIWGIYGDGGQCELYICGNVIENFVGDAILVNGGWDNIVLNNYFINVKTGVDVSSIMKGNYTGFNKHHHPRLDTVKDEIMNSEAWKERFPAFFAMMAVPDSEKGIPHGNVVANNIAYKCKAITPQTYGNATVEQNLDLKQNPGFYDADKSDYNLKADSALFTQLPGFKAVPFTRMGRVSSLARGRVQNAVLMAVGSPRGMAKGQIVPIDSESLSVAPFIDGDRTYVPLRFLAENLGAGVNFENGTITISDTAVNLEMKLNSTAAKKNGETLTLEKAPVVVEGRTMVPLRQVSEFLDRQVFWDASGLIAISDDAALFDTKGGTDVPIIHFLREQLSYY